MFTIIDYGKQPRPLYVQIVRYLKLVIDEARQTNGAKPPRLCAVFDIDETLICTRPRQEDDQDNDADDDDGGNEQWARHPLGWNLYMWCLANGINVRIVTARDATPSNVKFTMEQLRMSGYTSGGSVTRADGRVPLIGDDACDKVRLYMYPAQGRGVGAAKRSVRAELAASGERIILSVGDQITDHVDPASPAMASQLAQRFHPETYYCLRSNQSPPVALCVKTAEVYHGWPARASE